jgi:alanyl-tRNA synthetase
LLLPTKRFDFSHFTRPTREELIRVEMMVNKIVRENVNRRVIEGLTMDQAKEMGAIALFGEKYGDTVRVVTFGDSVELCGGTHIENTGSIGILKIISEGAIAAGIRRIEAVTALRAEEYINEKLGNAEEAAALLKITGDLKEGVSKLIDENITLKKSLEKYRAQMALVKVTELEKTHKVIIFQIVSVSWNQSSPETLKTIAYHNVINK